jgi:lysyl-tRNA synthetase class 2
MDPGEHRERFARDNDSRRQRDLPEVASDNAFLEALEAGLPNCAGVAVGFDRLVMLALGADGLDQVLTFRGQ